MQSTTAPNISAPFLFPVAKIVFNEKNPRKISKAQLAKLIQSIKEFESMLWIRPIVIDENNTALGGNQRGKAAKLAGLVVVPVIRATGLSEEQKKEFIVKDNVGFGDWDWEMLNTSDWEIEKLEHWGLEIPAGEILLAGETAEDNFEAPEKIETEIKHGDILQIGAHRLLCSDSRSAENIAKLMNGKKAALIFTDPPYGVSAGGGRSQTVEKLEMKEIANDELRGPQLVEFLNQCFSILPEHLTAEASIYICYDHKTQKEFFTSAIDAMKWKHQNTIVWNKNVFGLSGHKGYRPKFELILFCSVEDSYLWNAGNDQANVWDIARPNAKEREGNHRTPKPVAVPGRAINNSSKPGEVVLDVFAGVGSTMVAAEQLKRICYASEFEPQHCESIVRRMHKSFPELKITLNDVEYYGTK